MPLGIIFYWESVTIGTYLPLCSRDFGALCGPLQGHLLFFRLASTGTVGQPHFLLQGVVFFLRYLLCGALCGLPQGCMAMTSTGTRVRGESRAIPDYPTYLQQTQMHNVARGVSEYCHIMLCDNLFLGSRI